MSKTNSAIILCAGKSSRFGENKLLIKFGENKYTLPQYAVRFCIDNNIKNIYVTINKDNVKMNWKLNNICHPIIDDINNIIDPFNINVSYKFQDENEYGPAAAIKCWQDIIMEDFIVLFGDNYYKGSLPDLEIKEKTAFASYKELSINPKNLQLAAIVDNYLIEKPHAFLEGNYFCGYLVFSKDIMINKYCDKIQKSNRNEYEITDLFNFVENRNIILNELKWTDITYKNDIEKVENYIKKNE